MSAAVVLLVPVSGLDGSDDAGAADTADAADGLRENKARSGGRSASYEQKKRPMYGAVPSSAAARPRYAARKRDENVFTGVSAFLVDCNGVVCLLAMVVESAVFPFRTGTSSPRKSDRIAARSVG